MNSIFKFLILAAACSFFGAAQATCLIVAEPDGESCTGTNPLRGACAWTPVNGGYICARNAVTDTIVVPKHIPRDKVKQVGLTGQVQSTNKDTVYENAQIKTKHDTVKNSINNIR